MREAAWRRTPSRLFLPLLFFALALSARAEVYLYPGSFDPFHVTHESEVRALLTRSPSAKVRVYPIADAYYRHAEGAGIRPSLLSIEFREKLIRAVFVADHGRIEVRRDLRKIERFVFDELRAVVTAAARETGEPAILYVGTDVVELWRRLPGFSAFVAEVDLLIGKDPLQPELYESLRRSLAGQARVRFTEAPHAGVRSFAISEALAGLTSPAALEDASLNRRLSAPAIRFFRENWKDFLDERARFKQEAEAYLLEFARSRSLPALEAAGLDAAICKWIRQDRETLAWFSRRIVTDLRGAAALISTVVERMPPSLRRTPGGRYAYSDFVDTYSRSEAVADTFREVSRSQLLLRNESAAGRRAPWRRAIDYLSRRAYKAAYPLGKALKVKQPEKLRYPDPELDRRIPSATFDPEREITVYRGVKRTADIETRLAAWRKEGFLSKSALKARIAGQNVESSIQVSESALQREGIKSAGINHVLGSWHEETALISTTLDKEIAIGVAGEGGLVFTLQVKRGAGIFINDPAFWQGTPWERTGSPFSEAQEFAVFHQIDPTAFIDVEEIGGDPKLAKSHALPGYKRILRSIPGMLLERCRKLFESV